MEIDEEFLKEVGLDSLSEDQKREFIRKTQEELEVRVGEEISRGLSLEQIKEFEALSEGDQRAIRKVVFEMESDFREDKAYQALLKRAGKESGDWQVLGEYLSIKWIQKNRPDYTEVVERIFRELKDEIKSSR